MNCTPPHDQLTHLLQLAYLKYRYPPIVALIFPRDLQVQLLLQVESKVLPLAQGYGNVAGGGQLPTEVRINRRRYSFTGHTSCCGMVKGSPVEGGDTEAESRSQT